MKGCSVWAYMARPHMINKKGDKLMNKQNKISPQTSNRVKNNLETNNKTKQEIDYFIAGPGIEANRIAGAETRSKMHNG